MTLGQPGTRVKAAGFALGREHHRLEPAPPETWAPLDRLTALRLDAEPVFEALVGVGAGDHLRVRAPRVHVFGANNDVAAITLESGH